MSGNFFETSDESNEQSFQLCTRTQYFIAEYVWIGGNGELRSKTRVIYLSKPQMTGCRLSDIPVWNYDGSSTGQANGSDSEVFLCPKSIYNCPFRRHVNGVIVMCDTYDVNGIPLDTNHRHNANLIFEKYQNEKSWYGLEQEYFIFRKDTNQPIGMEYASKQGQYYCSVGSQNAYGRRISDEHMEACLYAGIKISGTNLEVAPGQHEFQIGPVEGIAAADQLWVARFILEKISEHYDRYIVYHPKPLQGDWNGSGCHTNFSTESMRSEGGLKVIMEAIDKLRTKHSEHMKVYGIDNDLRLTGKHETASIDEFSHGIGSRQCSVRIPNDTVKNGCGYFEDRRPAANIDPYQVTSIILQTVCESD